MNTPPSVYQIFVCADVFFCHLETVSTAFYINFFFVHSLFLAQNKQKLLSHLT